DAERHRARADVARRDLNSLRRLFDDHRRRTGLAGDADAAQNEARYGDQARQRSGADRCPRGHMQSLHADQRGAVSVLTPKRTVLRRWSFEFSAIPPSGVDDCESVRLRSVSDSVPSCRDSAIVSACCGVSSIVAVLPTTTLVPFFSSTAWSI